MIQGSRCFEPSYRIVCPKLSVSCKMKGIEFGDAKEDVSYFKFESSLKPFIVWFTLSTGVDITRLKTNGREKKIASISLILKGFLLMFLNCTNTGIFK